MVQRVYQPISFITEEDLTSYGWQNKTASGDAKFTSENITYLIQSASRAVQNHIVKHTKNKIKVTSIEQITPVFRDCVQEATLITFDNYTRAGQYFSEIKTLVNTGTLNVEQENKLILIPIMAVDALLPLIDVLNGGVANVISSEFINSYDITNPIPVHTVTLVNEGEALIELLSKKAFLKYLQDIETGEVPNLSGDIWSETKLIKQLNDTLEIDTSLTVNQKLTNYATTNSLNDYVTTDNFTTSQQNQDALIFANTAQIAAVRNKNTNQDTAIKNIEQAIVSSATDLATYVGSGTPATVGTTPVTLTPTVQKDFYNNTYVGYSTGIWLIKDNINIKLDVLANIARTTFNGPINVTLRLVNQLNVVLDSQVVTFDFTNTSVYNQQTSILATRFTNIDNLDSNTYQSIHLEILTSVNTVSASNLKLAFGFSTNENASRASSTNDIINVSSVVGNTATNAFDTLDQKNISQDAITNGISEDLTNLQTQVDGLGTITDVVLIDDILYNDGEIIIIENYLQYYNLNLVTLPGGTQSPYYNYNIILNGYNTKLERLSLSSSGQFYAMAVVNGANLELTLEFPPISGAPSTMALSVLGQIKE